MPKNNEFNKINYFSDVQKTDLSIQNTVCNPRKARIQRGPKEGYLDLFGKEK